MSKLISGRIYGTPDRALAAYYRQTIRDHHRAGVQFAFRYY